MSLLNYQTMKAACELLKHEFNQNTPLTAYNLTTDDMADLCDAGLWTSVDRIKITRTLSAMRDGLAAGIGYPPFQVPAEWMAAVIHQFVHPVNKRTACAWTADTFIPSNDMIDGGAGETVSASKLFALVLLASQEDTSEFQGLFDSKVKKAVSKKETT